MDVWDFRKGGRIAGGIGKGGARNCTRGKSCGATCISQDKYCWVNLPGGKPGSNGGKNLHDALGKVRQLVQSRGNNPELIGGENSSAAPSKVRKKPQGKSPTAAPITQPEPQRSREAVNSDQTLKIREAQNEKLRREFAPKEGKVRSIGLNGKTDEVGTEAINKGLNAIRETSDDANKKIDTLMKALEKNPIPVLGRDQFYKPEDVTVGGKVLGLAATVSDFRGGRNAESIIKTLRETGLDKSNNAYALMDSQVVVMTGHRVTKQTTQSAPAATYNLRDAADSNPKKWAWAEGSGSTYLHEVGHVMHARAFKGKNRQEIVEETEAQLKDLGIKSVSKYGQTNALETTAELYTAYMMNGKQLKEEMPAAYQWMDTLVQNAYNYNP